MNSKFLVSGSDDKRILLWNLEPNSPFQLFEGHTKEINCVMISSDCKLIVSCSNDFSVILWETETK
jgi:WD40 repeat protein